MLQNIKLKHHILAQNAITNALVSDSQKTEVINIPKEEKVLLKFQ